MILAEIGGSGLVGVATRIDMPMADAGVIPAARNHSVADPRNLWQITRHGCCRGFADTGAGVFLEVVLGAALVNGLHGARTLPQSRGEEVRLMAQWRVVAGRVRRLKPSTWS